MAAERAHQPPAGMPAEALAEGVATFLDEAPLVLGLVGGGVALASRLAGDLGAEHDVALVDEIREPEGGGVIGAIAEGGAIWIAPVDERRMEILSRLEAHAIERLRWIRAYRSRCELPAMDGRTVVVVDAPVARPGASIAVARTARELGARRLILAAPLVAPDDVAGVRSIFDHVVSGVATGGFAGRGAVGEDGARAELAEASARRAEAGARRAGGSSAAFDGREREHVVLTYDDPAGTHRELDGVLSMPARPRGVAIFVHDRLSTHCSPRNQFVARELGSAGFATLLFDLLDAEEFAAHEAPRRLRFDADTLARRVVRAMAWVAIEPRTRELPIALFGAGTGAAAALVAAARVPEQVAAIVTRGARVDLVDAGTLGRVRAPTLLLVGREDERILAANHEAVRHLPAARLEVLAGATDLFTEPGALRAVSQLTTQWFGRHARRKHDPPDLEPWGAYPA